MYGFSKKRFKLYQTALVVIVVVHAIVTSAIDLFHNEDCQLGTVNTSSTDIIYCNNPCPACMFLACYNSTQDNYETVSVSTKDVFILQILPHVTAVNHNEWACSIILRAPPSITIS